ncbi:MAG: c-type cytochrome [Armatimonadota bacterium]
MKRAAAWAGVVLLPVIVLGGLWGTRRDLSKPNWFVPTRMAESPAYKTQSANPVLPDNMTMQPPVPGTLARGAHPFHFGSTDDDRARAGRELANPFSPSPESLGRGQFVYETYCLVCHGASGRGDGPMIPRFPNPPSFLAEGARELSDGEMFHTITLGRNKMGSHASQVSWDDRWQVILYIRSLQEENQ